MSFTNIYKDLLFLIQKMIGKNTTSEHTLTLVGKSILTGYEGTYAADEVPKTPFQYAIVNLDTRKQGGIHWIALARLDDGNYMVYDSFGRHTNKILPSLDLPTIDADHDAEQAKKEKNCGQRCLAWLCVFDAFGPDAAKSI